MLREQFARTRAGSRDRAAIGALVYGVLRNYFALRERLGGDAAPEALCEGLAELGALDRAALPPSARHNLPPALWDALSAQYGEPEAAALADALNEPAFVDLRVNVLKATREQAQAALAAEGIAAQPIAGVATGLRLSRRAPLQATRAFRDGLVEPQDEGSQRLAGYAAPKPRERVADFCAGAGGKTLALGALMRNEGELHAFDVSRARLARLGPRLARSGLTIVRETALVDENDPALAPLAGHFDVVLVDAPCSGTGTLRRNPELRLRTPDLPALAAAQWRILAAAARLVRPGGRLVYATCSVLRGENEAVVERFLADHPAFRADGASMILLPHRDLTDGFFAARLARSEPGARP